MVVFVLIPFRGMSDEKERCSLFCNCAHNFNYSTINLLVTMLVIKFYRSIGLPLISIIDFNRGFVIVLFSAHFVLFSS